MLEQRGFCTTDGIRIGFVGLPGIETDHSKIRVTVIGEGTNNVGLRFEPTEVVWRVQTGETLSEQIAFGATNVFGSESLGLDAFGFKCDVEVQGDASGNISVLVEGVNRVVGEEFFITAPPVEQVVERGSRFALQPDGASIFLRASLNGGIAMSSSFEILGIEATFNLPLVFAVLAASRSVEVGGVPATAFLTGSNSSTDNATACGIAAGTSIPADFTFQTTDPLTNAVVGSPDTPVDVAAREAQSFVFAFTPTAAFAPTDIALVFDWSDTVPAATVTGLNTLLLSASDTPVPDVVALAATLDNDGIVKPSSTGVFAVATVNVGVDGTITATADTRTAVVPVTISICETDPERGLLGSARGRGYWRHHPDRCGRDTDVRDLPR